MIPVLLIVIPLIGGLVNFFLKAEKAAKSWAVLVSLASLVVALWGVYQSDAALLNYDAPWLPQLGSRFSFTMDGMSTMLCLLTAVSFPLIFIATYNNKYVSPNAFYGLMLLTQTGLTGVFTASDALLFYFFWELALIPVYFLCSKWGGEKRIAVTFKFFVYTFLGSLLMLTGILYLYYQTPNHSFAMQAFYDIPFDGKHSVVLFTLFFVAFAIKMPIFPFHTWQPDTYEQSPTAVTMVLSGIMVKMGLFAVVRWLLPVFPEAAAQWGQIVIILAVIGMIYASLIAIKQDDVKRLIAYSSIAHIGLMCAALFAGDKTGYQGVMIQMFSHGVNVIGLWILADYIEQQTGTRKLSELGGLASKAPALAIMLVVMALANVALPLTNAFVGEFMMFNGLFSYNVYIAAVAGVSIILAAIYTLWMVQKVIYGEAGQAALTITDMPFNIKLVLSILVVMVILFGVYPQPMIDLTNDAVNNLTAYLKQ
jgi:NADH-quinone oxidoreductase subunit M